MSETADSVLAELFALREEREPDCDPGDLTIEVQDDMPLTVVAQRGQTIGRGSSILAALVDAREHVRANRAYGLAGDEPLWTFEQAWGESERAREALRTLYNQRDDALAALNELVMLKDGPRDEEYERRKPLAWQHARNVVASR